MGNQKKSDLKWNVDNRRSMAIIVHRFEDLIKDLCHISAQTVVCADALSSENLDNSYVYSALMGIENELIILCKEMNESIEQISDCCELSDQDFVE